jgi:hypothetical protein
MSIINKIIRKLTFIKPLENVFYDDIRNTPIKMFWEIQKGDLISIVKERGSFFPTEKEIENAYFLLMDSYYLLFKRSQTAISEMESKFKYAKALSKYIKKPTPNNKMFMEMSKQKNAESETSVDDNSDDLALGEYISHLEFNYNFQISEEECSTYRFYNYLKTLKSQYKNNNK